MVFGGYQIGFKQVPGSCVLSSVQLEFGPLKVKAKKHKLPKLKVKGFSSSSSSSSDSSSDSD